MQEVVLKTRRRVHCGTVQLLANDRALCLREGLPGARLFCITCSLRCKHAPAAFISKCGQPEALEAEGPEVPIFEGAQGSEPPGRDSVAAGNGCSCAAPFASASAYVLHGLRLQRVPQPRPHAFHRRAAFIDRTRHGVHAVVSRIGPALPPTAEEPLEVAAQVPLLARIFFQLQTCPINPAATSCWGGEDFVGRVARIVRKLHRQSCDRRIVDRYLASLTQVWAV